MEREFRSEHAFHVFLEGDPPRRLGGTTEETEDGTPRLIAVPSHGWFVRPYDTDIRVTQLGELVEAVASASVPGLSLAGCRRLGDDAGAIVARASALEFLDLFNTSVGDAGLPPLASLRRLRSLSLAGTPVTDAGMAALAALPALESLDLAFTEIGDAGVERLRSLTSLRSLSLRSARVSNLGLATVAALSELRSLDLQETLITDEGIAELRPLAGTLEQLLLGYTRLTDACLDDLAALRGLRTIMLRATRVSPNRDRALSATLPGLGSQSTRGIVR